METEELREEPETVEETALAEETALHEESTGGEEPAEAGVDRRQEVETFLRTFPGVGVEDIPGEVWARAAGGLGLTGAWAIHENGLLRQRLAALEQNRENRARSLGSLGSRQSVSGGGSIEAYWEEAGS